MATMSLKIDGVAKAARRVGSFDKKIRTKVMRKAVRAGGAVTLKTAKAKAPRVNRGLSKSLVQKVKTYPNGNVVSIVGQDLGKVKKGGINAKKKKLKGGGISGRGDAVPSHLVENPTQAHLLPGRIRRGVQRGSHAILNAFPGGPPNAKGGTVFTRRIKHPGTSGAYFVRKAQASSATPAQRKIETKLIIEAAREAEAVKREVS